MHPGSNSAALNQTDAKLNDFIKRKIVTRVRDFAHSPNFGQGPDNDMYINHEFFIASIDNIKEFEEGEESYLMQRKLLNHKDQFTKFNT